MDDYDGYESSDELDGTETPVSGGYEIAESGDDDLTAMPDLMVGLELDDDPEAELYDAGSSPETQELMEGGGTALSDSWEDIDFSTTMNTPYELSVIDDMFEKGEIDIPVVDPNLEEPEFGAAHLPTEHTGTFEGDRGNSAFVPNSEEARAAMAEYGQDCVVYANDNPDFSPFTPHDTPYGRIDCEVQIAHMTPDRQNPTWEYGDRRPSGTSHDVNYDLGNFAQADNALVDRLIEQNPSLIEGLTPKEEAELRADMAEGIESWRTSNGLTWHECSDCVTMQLVPTVIHDACRHSGGVSMTRTLQEYGDVRRDY